jgi:predicted N-acetyltransferase YhbS
VLGLGPVAVQPDYCRQGIGSRLIGHSLNVR